MTDWRDLTLGDLITVKHGYAFKGQYFAASGDEIVLTPGNFPVAGGLHFREGKERYYTAPYPKEFKLSPGDLLVVMTDLKQDAPILGSPAFVPREPAVLHNQRLGLVRPKPSADIDIRFLYYLLLSDDTRSQLRATATGSTVRHTAPERIYRVQIRLPPRNVQETIGTILTALDDLIENSRRRIEVLERTAHAIYREWFVRFRFPGHENVTLVDSPLGHVPEDWVVSTCGDQLQILGGGTPSKKVPAYWDSGTIPWYIPSDLTKRPARFAPEPATHITREGLKRSSARLFPAGSVLMTSRATLGVLSIVTTEACCNQGFIVVLPDDRWPSSFIYEWLDHHAEELASLATGATFKEISKRTFKTVPFLVPPGDVLDRFRQAVAPVDDQVRVLDAKARALAALRDLLLPKLVSGAVDVSELELD